MSYLPTRRRRFTRLLSDHDEHCFGEYSCWYSSQTHNTQSKGRLYVLSGSLTYEPDDQSQLLHRVSYQQITTTKPANNTIHISYTHSTYQQTRKPWVFENSSGEIAVQLTASDTQQVLQLLNPLLMLAQALHSDAISLVTYKHDVQQLVAQHEADLKFNTSAISDFTEKPILQLHDTSSAASPSSSSSSCRVTVLTPLLATPALLYVTNKKLYIQYISISQSDRPVAYKLSDIVQLHDRRHDMNDNSLELYFQSTQKHTAAAGITTATLPAYSVYIQFTNADMRNSVKLSLLSFTPSTPYSSLHYWITEWLQRRIDNFTYLMQLNIFAGRSMHDLSQYPIFPWVVADYSSTQLKLDDAASYRALAKPIGTLNDERLQRFKKRYTEVKELNDPAQPPFLYGSFYSTPGYVLYYLVRSQPELMLSLQHGRFDKPDRLFTSLAQTWQSVCTAPTDLKELIPQFYDVDGVMTSYQSAAAPMAAASSSATSRPGHFLLNTSGLDLGILQNGTTVSDVALPPWSSDADDCIRQLRAALESDYVTEHLSEWIDLVFGYKMTGDEAVKADNVFYHISYPHYHLSSRLTSEQRESVTRQLHEFGQVPLQLFATKHPKPSAQKQLSASELTKLTNVQHPKSPKPAKKSQALTSQPSTATTASSTTSSPVRKLSGAAPPTAQPVHRGSPDKLPAVSPPVAAPVPVAAAESDAAKPANSSQPAAANVHGTVASVTSAFISRFWSKK